ncbi:hypothetical protein [Desulfobacula phenolica]|uniref:Lipoprotein n=1 Tax=Desulfobacula phenolica TaxID=90732 RepID=A0A1H2K750_9BACT|nr:hypothetical protein [Desulfobacula phenolica]SDU64560.1 hypothetical protein SAMN04487931_12231 [Desulfobacula phenolica]
MKNKCFYLMLLSIFFIASCSSAPKPITHEFSTQKQLEALQHWEILAMDFTKQIATIMKTKPWPMLNSPGFGHADENESKLSEIGEGLSVDLPYIYLQTNDISDFGKSFRTYLITELSKLGYSISHTPQNALMVRWSVNKIKHDADRTSSGFPVTGTMAVALGAGIYKLFDSNSAALPGALAVGATLDLLNSSMVNKPGDFFAAGEVSHVEIVLTFTVSKDTIILSRQSQAYYVNAEDFDHYNNIADYAGQESFLKPVEFQLTN